MADEKTHPDRGEAPPVSSMLTPEAEAFTGVPVWEDETGERGRGGAESRDDGGVAAASACDENPTATHRRQAGGGRGRQTRNDGVRDAESFGPRERLALGLLAVAIAAVAILPFFAVLVRDSWTSERSVTHTLELVEEEEVRSFAEQRREVGVATRTHGAAVEAGGAVLGDEDDGSGSGSGGGGGGGGVRSLTAATFRAFLEDNERAFVHYHAPWSLWCQRLYPAWDELAAAARFSPFVVGSVDCVAEAELCRLQSISVFPTLRWYEGGKAVKPDYNKWERTAETLLKYAEGRISIAYETMPEEASDSEEDGEKVNEDDDIRVGGDGDGDAKRKPGTQAPYMYQLYQLSPELAEICGKGILTRPQVLQALWAYIREHNLQNPSDKREIICDSKLQSIMGGNVKVDAIFSMSKHLSQHLVVLDKSAKLAEPDGPPPLTLDDVKVPSDEKPGEPVEPIKPPENGQYSAISRGILRIDEDGFHTCTGKWAITSQHYNNLQTNNFLFGLVAHAAQEAAEAMQKKDGGINGASPTALPTNTSISPVPSAILGTASFPVDSANYKGFFELRRGVSKTQSTVDKQIVLKFRQNSEGTYNIHGVGINNIGKFNLLGTLITNAGRNSGHIELYRMYTVPYDRLFKK